jgi:hypothetical protein
VAGAAHLPALQRGYVRTRFALWLDGLIVVALLLMLVIELTGGFFLHLNGVRLSGRSPDRALLAALGMLAVRLVIDRRSAFLGAPAGWWRDIWNRVYVREGHEVVRRPVRARDVVAAAAVLCAIGAALLREQLRSLYLVPDLGDPLFSMWRMGWVFRQLQGDPRRLFDGNIFHPEPLTLTYSDSMLLPSVMAAPLLLAGLHPVVVYNVLFLSAFLLSGLTTFLLVHRLTGCVRAAIVSGVIFAFYPYRFEHYSHLELQMTLWMPLGLLALHRFVETLRTRDLLLAAVCAVAQLYSSMYYGLFFGVYAAVVGAVLWGARGLSWRRLARPVAIAGTVALLVAIPLARPYLAAQARKGSRDVPAVRVYSATAADYFRAHERSARYGGLLGGGQQERELFPGVMPLALAAAVLVPPIGTAGAAYIAGLALSFDGSLGMNGLAYPYLYELFLPFRGLRVPARFSVLVGLSLAVLAGLAVHRLMRRLPGMSGSLACAAVVGLVAIDVEPDLRLAPVWRQPPAVYAGLASRPVMPGGAAAAGHRQPPVVLAEFPLPDDPDQFALNLPYMYFSIWHGLPLVNGYSGFAPPDYDAFAQAVADVPDRRAIERLRARGVTHVTLNCALYGDGCAAAMASFDASPLLRPVSRTAWQGQPVLLYELVRLPRGSDLDF